MANEDFKLPPPPQLFPEKIKNIDKEGCEAKQREFEDWWRKVANAMKSI